MGASIGGYTNSQSSQSSGAQANQYNGGQLALQGQINTALGNYLQTGQAPTGFTTNTAAQQNLNNQLNNQTNPAIAAQFGAGSPQVGAQDALAQTNLAAQTWQAGNQLFQNGLGLGESTAYTPIGQTQTSQNNTTQTGGSAGSYGTSLLSLLTGATANNGNTSNSAANTGARGFGSFIP